MRKPIIVGNWKMHKLLDEAVDTALKLKKLVSKATHCEVIVAPVFTALKALSNCLEDSDIKLAAQNCSTHTKHSANTGEICADMIKDVGASHIIIGHSERRQFHGETNKLVNRKTKSCLYFDLVAIVCVGETLEEREAGNARKIVKKQLISALQGLTAKDMKLIIIAYEPVWAIGTGKTATPKQAQEMHSFIRRVLTEVYARETAEKTKIVYGGSVKPSNIKELMNQEDIDGVLVGGASLEASSFAQIINYA